jgi:hypothetical protein
MLRNRSLVVVAGLAALAAGRTVEAQLARVFVSVNGNDLNVCSNIATPCRTLGGGVTQVDDNGEVIVIDSGSYAGATITKPVKINVAEGVVAFSGLPITVNPGADKMVALRGLTLKSATPLSGIGITVVSGRLSVERSVIDGWFTGIDLQAGAEKLWVGETIFRNNQAPLQAASGTHVVIEGSRSINDERGFTFLAGSTGVFSKTEISGRLYAAYVAGVVTVSDCRISDKQVALWVDVGGVLRLSGTVVTKNLTGIKNDLGGVYETYGTNQIRGNTTDLVGPFTPVALK